jgi:hypothetical protein
MPDPTTSTDEGSSKPNAASKSPPQVPNNTENYLNGDNKNKEDPITTIDYNPRWMGYCYIILSSLVNFCSVANVPGETRATFWYLSIAFGVLSFVMASLILIQDWSQPYQRLRGGIRTDRTGGMVDHRRGLHYATRWHCLCGQQHLVLGLAVSLFVHLHLERVERLQGYSEH